MESGVSYRETTRKTGISNAALFKYLPGLGTKQKPKTVSQPKEKVQKHSAEDWEFAKTLLEDGASYREVAYTTGIPKSTLIDNLPNMSQWTPAMGRAMISTIKKNQEMFDQLYDPGRRKG